jgi:hypothetical protein
MFKISKESVIDKFVENGYSFSKKGLLGDLVYANPNIPDRIGPIRFIMITPLLNQTNEYLIRLSLELDNALLVTENDIFLHKFGNNNKIPLTEEEFWDKLQFLLTGSLDTMEPQLPKLVPLDESDELANKMKTDIDLGNDEQHDSEKIPEEVSANVTKFVDLFEQFTEILKSTYRLSSNKKDDDRPVYL